MPTITETTDAAQGAATIYAMAAGDTFVGESFASYADTDSIAVSLTAGVTYTFTMTSTSDQYAHDFQFQLGADSAAPLFSIMGSDIQPGVITYTATATETLYLSTTDFTVDVDASPYEITMASTGAPADNVNLTQYYYGNSLVNFAGGGATSNVPYWMDQLIAHTNGDYAVNGGYGFLQQFADRPEPANEWGFSGVDGLWDTDFNTFSQVSFDQIIITPANFLQEVGPNAYYYGTTTSPLTATADVIADTIVDQPDADFFIYEGWSDLGLFSEAFPPSDAVMEAYYDYNQGAYHDWYVSYVDALEEQFPEATITLIPVAPVLAGLLSEDGLLGALNASDLFVDTAPHGTETLYFLASLINYQATVGAPAPADFPVPAGINSLVANNFAAIVDFIETESAVYTGGEGPAEPIFNTIIGTDDAESIGGTIEADSIEGNGGNDTLRGQDGDDHINGGDGNDRGYGGNGDDLVIGGAGNDRLEGNKGNDTLEGGEGNDVLKGHDGDDSIEGGAGKDNILGGAGSDYIDGGDGNDFIRGHGGDDTILGGEGGDVIRAGDGADIVYGGAARDKLEGGNGDDFLHTGEGDDRGFGGAGNDTIIGEEGRDQLHGGDDDDFIDSGAGADNIWGDAGDDTIIGGAGNDELEGGSGADVFVFATGHGNDTLSDFEDGVDLFDITGLGFDLVAQITSGELNITIDAGDTFHFANGTDSITLENNSGSDIVLTEADFIYEDIFAVG